MERASSTPLIVLGLYLFATLFKRSKAHGQIRLPLRNLSPKTTFVIGIIHGIGAETATQVMLLAGLGSVQAHAPELLAVAIGTLMAFIGGLMIANTAIALACSGMVNLTNRPGLRPAYVACGAIAAGFSVFTGIKYLLWRVVAKGQMKIMMGKECGEADYQSVISMSKRGAGR
ncbi:MAG: hypothetical protein J0H83_08955 [Candidatus Melainabacteria bacterium]|nr:hypothetical protein [Candidatus Melainabacteria bacterium]